jgi:hypothetical protein
MASTEFLVFRFENWTNYSVGLIVHFFMGNVPELDPEDNVFICNRDLSVKICFRKFF